MTVGSTVLLSAIAALIIIYIYTVLQILRWEEEEFTLPNKEDQMHSKIMEARVKEIVAWIFLALGIIVDVIGFFQASIQDSLFFIILGGCVVIVSFFTITNYKKERSKYVQQLKKRQKT